MEYLHIANSAIFYIIGIIIVSFVVFQSIVLLRMALKRGKTVGLTRQQVRAAMRASISVSILPSIATTIGFFTLAPLLGIPIPWIRLSIIGGLSVELAAASMGATAAGVDSFSAGFTPIAFAAAVWAMTFATMWYLLICSLFLKKISKAIAKGKDKDQKWSNILVNSVMMAMLSIFFMRPAVAGGNDLVTLIASCVIMLAVIAIMRLSKKLDFLKEFAMPISMLGSMIVVIIYAM